MKEYREVCIAVGFKKSPKKIFDEVEFISAALIREGWKLTETCVEDGMANIHLFFERYTPPH